MPHPVENKTRAIVRLRRIYAQAESFGHADCTLESVSKADVEHERIHATIDETITLVRSYLK